MAWQESLDRIARRVLSQSEDSRILQAYRYHQHHPYDAPGTNSGTMNLNSCRNDRHENGIHYICEKIWLTIIWKIRWRP